METLVHSLLPTEYTDHHLGLLHEIPEPPKKLWYRGALPPKNITLLAVVGSRQYSTYGKQVIETLFKDLASYPIGIVSGLARGIDTLAHEAALENRLYTLAVPGSGLSDTVLYPAQNKRLADRILEQGGGLLSELEPSARAAVWTFPRRNRIMAGLSMATLLIEASAKSGTLITARLAVDYNRELLAVPGNIFSVNSHGVHQFIKLGATVVTEASDILTALRIPERDTTVTPTTPTLSEAEVRVLAVLLEPLPKDMLIRNLGLGTAEASSLLMQMELKGILKYEAPYYYNLLK
jgi:DNA processing protein